MQGELSAGLPRLGTVDRYVVSLRTGAPVRLRGVNRSGLEYAVPDPPGGARGFLDAVGIDEAEIATIAREWGANVIRIPFNQDFALNGSRGRSAEDYLVALDTVIAWAARHDCYTLLDLQWLDITRVFGTTDGMGMTPNRVAPLPDASSVTLWTTLARRYAEEPAVLFDLFNEPHDLLADDPHGLARRLSRRHHRADPRPPRRHAAMAAVGAPPDRRDPRASSARVDLRIRRRLGLRPARHAAR